MPKVLITPEALRDQPGPFIDLLHSSGFEVIYPTVPTFARGHLDVDATVDQLATVDAAIASGERYDRDTIARLPQLRVIARCGVGYDRVDVAAATEFGKVVTITPLANRGAVAELTLALLFAVTKSMVTNDRAVRDGQWPRQLVQPLRGSTLGIVGLGRIGQALAVRALALDMHVIASETYPDEGFLAEHPIELLPLSELLPRSDFVSVHCPLNDATQGLFNRDRFAEMKPGSVFLNTARGHLVVEEDLLEALQSGHLAGAGLDVLRQEPPDRNHPLLQMEQVVFSPHIAGCDEASMAAMALEAAQCIVDLSADRWPAGAVVNDALKDNWQWAI